MLKTIQKSANKKLGGCAATYRAGLENVYSTCPSGCPLKPPETSGSSGLDEEYLQAVLKAVPSGGIAWTYTHFPRGGIPLPTPGGEETCINISTDTVEEAKASFLEGRPTVVVRPSDQEAKVDVDSGIRFVRCPAEYHPNITCGNCGGDIPLCARADRDYIIKFTAHGNKAKVVSIRLSGAAGAPNGGCYGNGGPVRLQWEKTKGTTSGDAQAVLEFARSLPQGAKLRHHVVGDFG